MAVVLACLLFHMAFPPLLRELFYLDFDSLFRLRLNAVTSELWDGEAARLLRNVTRKRPRFELDNLQSGKRLIIKIYSANKKGKQREQY